MIKKKPNPKKYNTGKNAPATKGDIEKLNRSFNIVAGQVAKHASEIPEIRKDIASMRDDLSSLRGSVVVIENRMGELVAIMKEGSGPKIKDHTQQIENHEERITGLAGAG